MWPKANFDQISKFHFLKFWQTNSTMLKYRQRALIWMVTSWDFVHRLKSYSHLTKLHQTLWQWKGLGKIEITQQIQQMPRMGKMEEDWNGLKLGFLKTVQPNSFSKFISAVCNFKNNAQETYLFVSNLWLCHLHVISLLTLSSIAIEGE